VKTPTRQEQLGTIVWLIHKGERERDDHEEAIRKINAELWKLRVKQRNITDAIEREALASTDPAGLDRLQAAVDAVSPAIPKFDILDFAARVCGVKPYQMTRREFQEAERWES